MLNRLRYRNREKIYVLRLSGAIGMSKRGFQKSGISFEGIRKDAYKAFEDKMTKAVVLLINSPGGSPGQSELIYRYIRSLSKINSVPVYSFVEDIAASGGYWLACAGQEIYALDTSIVGSIGVVSAGFGFVDLMKKIGIQRRSITQGKSKMIWDPFSEEKESDKKIIESIQKDTYETFKKLVKDSRNEKLNIEEDKLFSGEFWTGTSAKKYGLVDGIGDFYTVMRQKFGEKAEFVFVEKKESMLNKLLGLSVRHDVVEDVIDTIEEKLAFTKFRLW